MTLLARFTTELRWSLNRASSSRGFRVRRASKPAANDVLEKWPVSKRVNKIGIDDDATLIDQISLP